MGIRCALCVAVAITFLGRTEDSLGQAAHVTGAIHDAGAEERAREIVALAAATSSLSARTFPNRETAIARAREILGVPASRREMFSDVQVAYMLTDDGDLQDGLILGYTFVKELRASTAAVALPLLANFDVTGAMKAIREVPTLEEAKAKALESIADVAATRRGAVLGLFPYWKPEESFFTLHGSAEARAQSFVGTEETDDETRWLVQGRASVGIELHADDLPGGPVYGGLALAGHLFSGKRYEALFDENRSTLLFLEAHFGFPLPVGDKGYSVFGEYVTSLSDAATDIEGLRLGVLVSP